MSQALTDGDVAEQGLALTPRHRALIEAIAGAASRGKTISREQAGTAAGYAAGESARVAASRALALPHVRAALTRRLREMAQVDAASSLAMLRHLEVGAKSERVRLDAALAGMRIGGLDAGDQQHTGAAVAVQIVFRTAAGTVLTQPIDHQPQAQVIRHVQPIVHSLAEGEPEDEGGGEVEPGRGAKGRGGSKTRAARPPPAPAHNSPPKKSRGVKSVVRKSSKRVAKPAKAVPVRKGRVLVLSDAERARRSAAASARNAARAAAKGNADG